MLMRDSRLVSCHTSNDAFSETRSGQMQGTCPPG